MDRRAILERFDDQMRRRPPLDAGGRLEEAPGIVRVIDDNSWISYFMLDEASASQAVDNEVELSRQRGGELEWKVYGHDGPPTLPPLLGERGFVPDPPETLLVLDLAEPRPPADEVEGLQIARVTDRRGLEAAVAVSEGAFGPGEGWGFDAYLPRLGDPSFEVFLASVGGTNVGAGRLEMPQGRDFASLWGGGTTPAKRGLGIYRRLVLERMTFARQRGYRYLTVDARETSRPILNRLGFESVDSIVGWVLRPSHPR